MRWDAASEGLLPRLFARSLAIDPLTHTNLYAGTFDRGVFRSSDGGRSWIAVNAGSRYQLLVLFARSVVSALAIDPVDSGTVYTIAGDPNDQENGVFKTTDSGEIWFAVSNGLPCLDSTLSALAVDPTNPGTVYAGGPVDFKTTDGGFAWRPANSRLPGGLVSALVIDPTNSRTVYAGFFGGGVFRTTDGGLAGFPGTTVSRAPPSSVPSRSIRIVPQRCTQGSSPGSVAKTVDGGASWSVASTGLPAFVRSLAIDPANPETVYAGTEQWGVQDHGRRQDLDIVQSRSDQHDHL